MSLLEFAFEGKSEKKTNVFIGEKVFGKGSTDTQTQLVRAHAQSVEAYFCRPECESCEERKKESERERERERRPFELSRLICNLVLRKELANM